MTLAHKLDAPACLASPAQDEAVGLIRSSAELAALEAAWRTLGARTGGPMEQFDWVSVCVTNEGCECDPRIVAFTRGDRLAAAAPLGVKRVHGVPRRVMLGVDKYYEPMDLLAADEQAMGALATALSRDRTPMILGRLPADSPSVESLRRAFGGRAIVVTRPQPSFPYIVLDESWQDPDQHLNSGRRSDLRRARRKAEKVGKITIDILTPTLDALEPMLDEAFAVEARSWKAQTGTALACSPREAALYREYARSTCRQGILRMCFLRIDGQAAAMQMAVEVADAFWLLKIGYDAGYSHCSPGILLLRESIAWAARAGLKSFEFLGQSEPWIAIWTDLQRDCVSMRVYPYGLRGMAAFAVDSGLKLRHRIAEGARSMSGKCRGLVKACAAPIVKRVARQYIAGESLAAAMKVRERLTKSGQSVTLGYWNGADDAPRAVADQYLAALDAIQEGPGDDYVSTKVTALQFSADLFGEVAARAAKANRRIHVDAMAHDTADRTRDLIDKTLNKHKGVDMGVTLPGRWARSVDDAKWACERGLYVRVVKGEWADPDDAGRDAHTGYIEVIDQLAGHARHVGVATHHTGLAAQAIKRLRDAGTPCHLELLYGLPTRKSLKLARELGVPVRSYIPFGAAYMPYALSQLRKKPRIAWWVVRDLVGSLLPCLLTLM